MSNSGKIDDQIRERKNFQIGRHEIVSNPESSDDLSFTSRDSEGRISWWDIEYPKTAYWNVHHALGRAYAVELLDMMFNTKNDSEFNPKILGHVATQIVLEAARGNMNGMDGVYIGFFEMISEQLVEGLRARAPR